MGSQLIISCSGIPDAQTLFKKKKKQQPVLQFPSYHRYRLRHVPFSGERPMVNSLKNYSVNKKLKIVKLSCCLCKLHTVYRELFCKFHSV